MGQPGHQASGAHEVTAGLAHFDLRPYRLLRVAAEMFFDAQQARIRLSNRAGKWAKAAGTPDRHVVPEWMEFEIEQAVVSEKRMRLVLARQYRVTAPPGVIAWQKASKGIGEDLTARLLGHLGHPRAATPSRWVGSGSKRELVWGDPFKRTVGGLWQYCGHGSQGRPSRGMSAEELFALGNPTLKMIVYLMASRAILEPGTKTQQEPKRCAKTIHGAAPAGTIPDPATPGTEPSDCPPGRDSSATSPSHPTEPIPQPGVWPYRIVYEERRKVTSNRVHAESCVRCGPSGHPAQPGSPWSAGHQLGDALRFVGKEILRDLWVAAG